MTFSSCQLSLFSLLVLMVVEKCYPVMPKRLILNIHMMFLSPFHQLTILSMILRQKKYVGRFSTSESRGSVLGANTMRGHDIYFDISENGRIGIARSNCDYNALIGLDIQIEDKASGQQPRENDDYYESGNLSKLANPDTQDSSSMLTTLFDQIGNIGVAAIVCAVVIAVVVIKRVSDRRRAQYQAANLEKEHLNELQLDTEIQMGEIS
eukprot:385150_1